MSEARAIQRTARQSPYKMRLVIDQVRGMNVNEALALLKFSKKHAAKQIEKVLKSAVANAEQASRNANEPLDVDALFVKKAIVNEGPPAQALHAGGDGTGHTNPQTHQPHRRSSWARRKVDNGTENQSDRFPPRRLEAVALEVVREERLSGAAQGRRAAPEVPEGAPRERGDRRHHHRTQAGEGRRDHPHGASGRGDRQEGRRGRGAEE